MANDNAGETKPWQVTRMGQFYKESDTGEDEWLTSDDLDALEAESATLRAELERLRVEYKATGARVEQTDAEVLATKAELLERAYKMLPPTWSGRSELRELIDALTAKEQADG